MDYYELEDGKRYYISPLEIFTGIDERGYKLAKNALDVRLMPNFILNAEATEWKEWYNEEVEKWKDGG